MTTFTSTYPHYEHLRKKWVAKRKNAEESFWQKHSDSLRQLMLGGLGSALILTTPGQSLSLPTPTGFDTQHLDKTEDKNRLLAESLKGNVPSEVRKLTPQEELKISQILSNQLNLSVKSEISGIKLNRSYGLIGGEQHLYRYPGDNLYKHADTASEWAMYGDAGIAPGLGAWGYFAPSEGQFTEKEKLEEKYYIAVQTFLAPGFAENFAKYRDFFKYRKMLVVNPETGQAVVTDIADAGPSEWTGKHLGGSPEVMQALGLAQGPRKGAVLYFFIDDPRDQVPLGPIQVK